MDFRTGDTSNVYLVGDIRQMLIALLATNEQLGAGLPDVREVQIYCRGYRVAINAVAVAFGIDLAPTKRYEAERRAAGNWLLGE